MTAVAHTLSGRNKWHRYIMFLSLGLIIISLPFSLAINSIAMGLMAVNWVFSPKNYREISNETKGWIAVSTAYFLWMLLSLLWSADVASGLSDIQVKIPLLLFPLVFALSAPISRQEVEKLLMLFLATAAASAVVLHTFVVYFAITTDHGFFEVFQAYNYMQLSGLIGMHPAFLAMFWCFGVLIALYFIMYLRKYMLLLILASIYFTISIFHLGSRMGIVALVVTGTLFLFQYFYRINRIWMGVAGAVGILLLSFFLLNIFTSSELRFQNLFPDPQVLEDENFLNRLPGRLSIWYCGFEIIKENTISGVGAGDVYSAYNQCFSDHNYALGMEHRMNSHNMFLEAFVAGGIIGFLLFCTMIFVPLVLAIRQNRLLFLFFLLLIILCCLTENILNAQRGVVFLSLFYGLFLFKTYPPPDVLKA